MFSPVMEEEEQEYRSAANECGNAVTLAYAFHFCNILH